MPIQIPNFLKRVSKYRHKEKEYWTNKLARRRVRGRIQKVSRRRNRI